MSPSETPLPSKTDPRPDETAANLGRESQETLQDAQALATIHRKAGTAENTREKELLASIETKSTWPARIRSLHMTYKNAGQDFAKELYYAAISALEPDELDSLAKRRGVRRIFDHPSDPQIFEDFIVVFYELHQGYVRLAEAVREFEPDCITARMVGLLQEEILARELVNEWHRQRQAEFGVGDVEGRSARHTFFTGVLKKVMGILVPNDVLPRWDVIAALSSAETKVWSMNEE